ncbi:MAG: DEAD/DEAH box helicase family protein [Saprospiraceae bacterium]
MAAKEAKARIKINDLLLKAGWRFDDDDSGRANISLEHRGKKVKASNDDLGSDLENAPQGFIDYLLLNDQQQPIALVEAKRERIDPLTAKEQAREYARGKNIRHVFLSNGNVHYYWDLQQGDPTVISRFYSLIQLGEAKDWNPDPRKMLDQTIDEDYIALSQDPRWKDYGEQEKQLVRLNKDIRQLRPYQLDAVHRLRRKYAEDGERRFLFEMATGTGKTLTSAAVIKLFIRSGNANRVLFLVDRLELERQAYNDLRSYLNSGDDIRPVIYKNARDDWHQAQVVISTIQTLAADNTYEKKFSPFDFQLIISDEAHRTISGNNRAIFEYFSGAKLGLTATPRDYLKGLENASDLDPRSYERRSLLDTYRTFGCESGIPTFRFNLEDAVKPDPPYLCLPKLVDARTDITTEMLSQQGWTVKWKDEDGNEEEDTYFKRDFMRKFFSEETNRAFATHFLQHAQRDPVTGEIGKTIFFCVSRHHCTLITKHLNEVAAQLYPRPYTSGSDFAVQITSDIIGSQIRTLDFKNNSLNGWTQFNPDFPDYESSKTRVCVTVGMMTTGYDCPDVLNVVLARPIFSPTEYIQIKGRGTRLARFEYPSPKNATKTHSIRKDHFYLFDFFANHQYFQEEYDYAAKLVLPPPPTRTLKGPGLAAPPEYQHTGFDEVRQIKEETFTKDNLMRVDKEAFSKKFEEQAKEQLDADPALIEAVENEDWNLLWAYLQNNLFERPSEYWNMDKVQDLYEVDRRIRPEEILKKIFLPGYHIKTRSELAEEHFQRYITTAPVNGAKYEATKNLFSAYLLYDDIRHMFKSGDTSPLFSDLRLSIFDLRELGKDNIQQTINFIKDNVHLNLFEPK